MKRYLDINGLTHLIGKIKTLLAGKAPTSHASSATTYGVSSASNYGHAKASATTPKANGTASAGSETSSFARGDHVHPLQTTVSGNAGTATKLATARTIRTNLGSTSTASFDGSANVTPGVTGTLSIANGGTGATTAAGALTNLGLTATAAELNFMDGVTSNVQTQLNGKAASSHGTHVTYSTAAPKAAGTAAAGTAATVSRSDHVHPLQTSVSGNAGTATKLATARTISLTGDVTGSGSFDGSANLSISASRRKCVVGQTSSTTTNPYYKFASIQVTVANEDREIVFKVSTGYAKTEASGILRAHVRTGATNTVSAVHLYWEYANQGIDPSKFIIAHSTGASPTIELWVCIDSAWMMYHFDVLQEHNRTDAVNRWTLYNTRGAGSQSAVTSGYTQVQSTCLTINNPVTTITNTEIDAAFA